MNCTVEHRSKMFQGCVIKIEKLLTICIILFHTIHLYYFQKFIVETVLGNIKTEKFQLFVFNPFYVLEKTIILKILVHA